MVIIVGTVSAKEKGRQTTSRTSCEEGRVEESILEVEVFS